MSATVLFDTHRVIKRFIESGFTERQAEILIEEQKSIIENNLANKQDIAETNLRIESFRQETNTQIAEIKKEIAYFKSETNTQIAEIKKEITEIKKEIAYFKSETNTQIAEIKKEIAEIRKDIELMEKRIINKMYVSLFAYFGLFTTVMTAILTVIIKFL